MCGVSVTSHVRKPSKDLQNISLLEPVILSESYSVYVLNKLHRLKECIVAQ
jgi:hypothetical protein